MWHNAMSPCIRGSSMAWMSRCSGGSPARSSWLPRTRISSSEACRSRHCDIASIVVGACERAECRKSPRNTMRCTASRLTMLLSTSSVSPVVPLGTGTPSCRKLEALPKCASAINSVSLAGMNTAFSGSSIRSWPATRTVAIVVSEFTESPCVQGTGARGSADEQAQRGVQVFGRLALEAGARVALQPPDGKRRQHRGLRVRVDRRRCRAGRLGGAAQALAQLRLDLVEKLVHAREQAVVLEHQRIADHHARHA